MSVTIHNNIENITTGPWKVRAYNEVTGLTWLLGCLEMVRFSFSKAMREVICSQLDGPVDYRVRQPRVDVSFDQRELGSLNFQAALGSQALVNTGAGIDIEVGPGAGSNSTTAAPAEWHIVKVDFSGDPATFTLYAENRNLFKGTNTLGTEFDVYFAAKTNGDTAVTPASLGTGESVSLNAGVDDWRMGKFTFTIYDATVTQWTFDANEPLFTINGVKPIVESNVSTGDTVILVGLTYEYGLLYDASGTRIANTAIQQIQMPLLDEEAISLRMIHMFEKDRNGKALVIDIWKAINTTGMELSANSSGDSEMMLPARFTCLNDSYNHPNSPFYEIRIVDGVTMNFDTLI